MGKKIPILIGLIFVVLAVWLQISTVGFVEHFISRLESLAYDMQLRTKLATSPKHFKSDVVIVDVDDKSVAKEGRWPWSRSKLATLTTRLQEAGAVVIVFDMFFPTPEKNIAQEVLQAFNQEKVVTPQLDTLFKKITPLFDNDALYANSLKQSDTEIGMSFIPDPKIMGVLPPPVLSLTTAAQKQVDFIDAVGYIGNIPVLQNAVKTTGFVNVFSDEDGIIRNVPVLIRYQNNIYPSLALEAVRLYLLSKIELVTAEYGHSTRIEGVRLANHVIPVDSTAQVIIPFRGRSFSFPYYSATDVLSKKIPADAVTGKIVFVGTSATGLGDLKATAIESTFPGVEIQATVADGILTDNFSYKPAWSMGAETVLTVVLGIVFAVFFPRLGPRSLTFMIIAVPVALIIANNALWVRTGLIISIFIPIILTFTLALLNMIYGYLFETRRREHLKDMFGQYVPEEHIDEMLTASGSSYGMYGEDREMTVLFADIRNFTNISETLTATQLKEMLSDFFTPMTEIIFENQGTIDKYVGDMIMAFWGAPLKDKQHAAHAISAALQMQKVLTEIQPQLAAHGWPALDIGIGLNSGIMSVGDMGSKFRRNYTVIGDAVNLGSRVEGLTKHYGVKIIVSEFTEHQQKLFAFRQLDRVRVKGRAKGVGIYEVLCLKSELTPEMHYEVVESTMALSHYFKRDWKKAEELFTELHNAHPQVKLYKMYLERLENYEESPPPDDWDGVYTMKTK